MNHYRKTPQARQIRKLNKLHREAILAMYGCRCLASGCSETRPEYIQIAHIISKGSHPHLRHKFFNAVPLCHEHHADYDGRNGSGKISVIEHDLRERFSAVFELCDMHKNRYIPSNLDEEETHLKALIKEHS